MTGGWLPLLAIVLGADPAAPPLPKPAVLARKPEWLELAMPYLWLAGLLLAFALFVVWYRRRSLQGQDTVSASELLSDAREWEEEGELTEEEYRKLKANLAPRLKDPEASRKNGGDPAKRPRPQNP